MTIPTTIVASGPYIPNGATTVFPFGFKALSDTSVAVVLVASDGTETIVSSASYDVTLAAGDDPGGSVSFASAPVDDGRELWIYLDPTFLQEIKFEDEGAFNQTILNQLADEAGSRSLWLRERVERAFLLPRGPDARDGVKNKYPVVLADGTPGWSSGTGSDAGLRTDLAAAGGAALVNGVVRNGTGPLLIVIAGQSNALGANGGGPNPTNNRVRTWDAITGQWVQGGKYDALPWTRSSPNGNGGVNNFALGAANFITDTTSFDPYIILDATGGTSIDAWVASGTASVRYAALKAKIAAALASPAMVAAGKTKVDLLIWAQGEEDFVDSFSTHLNNLVTLDAQLRAETWMDKFTRCFITGMSKLHDRYEVSSALRHFCNKSNGKWRFISTRGLRTQYDLTATGDFTHWLGDDLYYGGYRLIGPAFLDGALSSPESDVGLAYSRANGLASPSEPTVIVTYDNLVNWQSRTGGPGVTDNFTGDGATTAFTLTSNGTISQVTVNGVVKTSPADYSVAGLTLTFTAAPGNTLPIVVSYGSAINGPAATGSISWGYRCYADGNYSFALGYLNTTGNGTNYSLAGGRETAFTDAADYSFAWGHQLSLQNTYQAAGGRGHTLVDSGTAAFGTFSAYTTTQTDPVVLQLGVGSSSAARSNAFAVRKSGVQEQKTTTVAALPAAGTAGRRAFVTDANATMTAGIGAIVAGGGANKVPVYDDGTNWRIG